MSALGLGKGQAVAGAVPNDASGGLTGLTLVKSDPAFKFPALIKKNAFKMLRSGSGFIGVMFPSHQKEGLMCNAILLLAAPASFIAAAVLVSPAVAKDRAKSISEMTVTKPVDASSPKLYQGRANNTKPGSSTKSALTPDKVEGGGENIRRTK
jgi:hypothetical protein